MSVELDPAELGFRRPFTREVTETLHLRNRNEEPVAFKVKTTAPKQYCVRPNSGRIEPGQHVEIQVLLQAMKEDPPADAKCRDKFLVQSTAITPSVDHANVAEIWSAVEKASKESIKERKIRVTFLPPGGSLTPAAATNGEGASHSEAPPAYSSPGPNFSSPKQPDTFDTPQKGSESLLTNPSAAIAVASSAISDAAGTTKDALQQQLESAKATIAQLQAQAQESGLRQRKGVSTSEKEAGEQPRAGTAVAQKPADGIRGVPVQIVAALCLLSFLIAYFFF